MSSGGVRSRSGCPVCMTLGQMSCGQAEVCGKKCFVSDVQSAFAGNPQDECTYARIAIRMISWQC